MKNNVCREALMTLLKNEASAIYSKAIKVCDKELSNEGVELSLEEFHWLIYKLETLPNYGLNNELKIVYNNDTVEVEHDYGSHTLYTEDGGMEMYDTLHVDGSEYKLYPFDTIRLYISASGHLDIALTSNDRKYNQVNHGTLLIHGAPNRFLD